MNASMKAVLPWIVYMVASATLAASAGEQPGTDHPTAIWRQAILPGTRFVVEPGTIAATRTSGGPQLAHLKAIIAWLSSEFGLPSVEESPTIAFASARRMIGLRYRAVPSDRWSRDSADPRPDTPRGPTSLLSTTTRQK